MDNNDENNQELNNQYIDNSINDSNVDEELDEIRFQKITDEAMRANEKLLSLEDIIADPEHQLTIIYGDDSILNISKVGDIMNDMRPITTDKKVLTPNNILIPQTNKALKEISSDPNGFVSVGVYSGIIIPNTPTKEESNVVNGSVQSKQFNNVASDQLIDESNSGESDGNNRIAQNYSSEVIDANTYDENNMNKSTNDNK